MTGGYLSNKILPDNRKICLLIFLLVVSGFRLISQPDHFRFSHLNINDGLSNNQVNCILKDSIGFMWFGTKSGLNRFDGYSFKIFRHDHHDSTSISDNYITSIFEDHLGKLWINTNNGLNIYDPRSETFYHDTALFLNALNISDISINKIYKDNNGNYWYIGTSSGLYKFLKKDDITLNFNHNPNDSTSIATNLISDICEDSENNIWIIHHNGVLEMMDYGSNKIVYRNYHLYGKYNGEYLEYGIFIDSDQDVWIYISNYARGIFYFDVQDKSFQHINTKSSNVKLNTDVVRGVVQDKNGFIWIGTDHGGINVLDKNNFTIRYMSHDKEYDKSLSQNSITSLYKDNIGTIWIGTFKKGINYHHEDMIKFSLFKNQVNDPDNLFYDDVNCFAENNNGNIWIGTNGGGLLYYNRKKNRLTSYTHDPKNPHSLSNDIIVSLFIDHRQKLWIGTYYGGLNCFDGKRFIHYRHNPSDPESLADDRVWEIFEDSERNLWVGTLGKGLDLMDRKTNTFHHYRFGEPNSVHSDYIFSIIEDQDKNLWIGHAHGLDFYDRKSNRFILYDNDINDPFSLSNNNTITIIEDSRGMIWVGTREGLNLFNKTRNNFKVFVMQDGLPDNTINTILEDNNGNLWISTINGLSNLIISKDLHSDSLIFSFKNYDASDGLQGKEFNENAALKTSRGELIFGGPNGFNIFNPGDIKQNLIVPELVITDFQIFNKSVNTGEEINGRLLFKQSITHTKQIVLKYSENIFSIEFAALSYFHPAKNKYAYILEDFNTDWLTTDGTQRKATYTNMDPGDYVFKVRASNNDGIWNEEGISLNITILPPFWKTRLAILIYVILVISILLISRTLIVRRERINNRIKQERQEAKHMHEMDMMKIKFFTNISHEFRTPLSLIINPINKLLNKTNDPEQKHKFLMISRNAKRLLNLANQLLDFRKMDIEEFRFNPSEGDITSVVNEVAESFSDLAEKKKIDFQTEAGVNNLNMIFDQDKLEKILYNLLSNAFKFTHEHGSISVKTSITDGINDDNNKRRWFEITVSDTGIGIPADKHDKIFERFFQNVVPSSTVINSGSGVGLALTKEFVKLHGGDISLRSNIDKGSSFNVRLPVKTADEYIAEQTSVDETEKSHKILSHHRIAGKFKRNRIDQKKPVILLVEDSEDFRFYLKDNLLEYYNIIEAANGREGWKKAVHSVPDLIVSDIIMSDMDGIELCRKVKNNQKTAHVPVILLTARATEKQKIEGFEAGADDYITKPFSFEILQSRISNLISLRKSLREDYIKQFQIQPREINITSLDEKLIRKAIDIVEKNISEPDFSVRDLSREMAMSRVHLYKKLSYITGKTPIEFIRLIRLKRAAQLLEKSQLTVSEIAYEVGFNSPKYFTKQFKAEYKILPSLYSENKRR
jgi:signal transduction histidine kinase/ligand-binding sensor domain-containing protein/DNA-binding response OmpR family regulator